MSFNRLYSFLQTTTKKFALALICLFTINSFSLYSTPSSTIEEELPVIILGSGVGALTSSIYLQRAGISTWIIEGENPGGALAQSAEVGNWPGIIQTEGITIVETMREQAKANGAKLFSQKVIKVDFSKHPFKIITQEIGSPLQHELKAKACIIALGSQPKQLNIKGENTYWTKGVYSCAVCDGSLYKGKTVAVVGGGDSAVLEADYLSKIAKQVYLIVRSDQLKTTEVVRKENLLQKENVKVFYNTTIEEIEGDGAQVTHIRLLGSKEEQKLPIDGVFVAIGATPNSSLFAGQLELDKQGYIVLEKGQAASIPGVFAIGDIVDPIFKQAISAAGDGSKAAFQIEDYLAKIKGETRSIVKEENLKKAEENNFSLTPSKNEKITDSKPGLKKINTNGKAPELTNTNEFYEAIGPHSTALVVEFYSPYCGPCRRLSPEFDAIYQTYQGKIRFLKVNVSQFSELSSNYNVYGVPKILVFDRSGKLIQEATGLDQIHALFNTLGNLVSSS